MNLRSSARPARSYSIRGVITIIALFLVITLLLAVTIYVEGRVFDGVRSFVRGEGLWAKAQKDAVLSLERYAHHHLESDYQAFEQALQVNLGDHKARLALLQSPPDMAMASDGFILGQNDRQDVDSMIWFFLNFRQVSYLREAIEVWQEGDRKIDELINVGRQIHLQVQSGITRDIDHSIVHLRSLNNELLQLENRFSQVLGEGARWVKSTVLLLTVMMLLIFGGITALISRRIIHAISASERKLIISEARFSSLKDSNTIGIASWSMDGMVLDANDHLLNMLGYNRLDLQNSSMNWISMTPQKFHERDAQAIRELELHGTCEPYEKCFFRKNGTLIPVYLGASMLEGDSEQGIAYLIDLTSRKQAEEAMKLATLIYQHSAEGVLITDENNLIVDINPAFTQQTGYTREDVIGQNPKFMQSGRHDKTFYRSMWRSLVKTGHWQGELADRRKDGSLHFKLANISVIRNSDGSIYRHVAQFFDITDQKSKAELIWQQANFDTLTGLPNRRLMHDRLEQEIKLTHRTGIPLALLFIDLDRFKEVNDTLGHNKGDLLLMEAARRIKARVRDTDTVARLGGDEFTIIISDFERQIQLDRIAQEILDTLCKPYPLGEDDVGYISASIGIAVYPRDASNMEDLMKHADQAMYAAKTAGRNCYSHFTQAMEQNALEKLTLTNDLRHALIRNEIEVYYQPIVRLADGHIEKAEALLRWHHPLRGAVCPSTFIPLAEEFGLIYELGNWVFHQTIAHIADWRTRLGHEVQISVNRSPIEFDRDFSNWLHALGKAGLPGNSITIEITEGLLLKKSQKVQQTLLQCRNHGIEVSIDDFGTGFSALSYLKQFDIDYLKIDRSFVSNIIENQSDQALVEAIIVMAHKLNIRTIAEGVETLAQRDLLRSFGCDYAQGYLYSAPLPAPAFEQLLQRNLIADISPESARLIDMCAVIHPENQGCASNTINTPAHSGVDITPH